MFWISIAAYILMGCIGMVVLYTSNADAYDHPGMLFWLGGVFWPLLLVFGIAYGIYLSFTMVMNPGRCLACKHPVRVHNNKRCTESKKDIIIDARGYKAHRSTDCKCTFDRIQARLNSTSERIKPESTTQPIIHNNLVQLIADKVSRRQWTS